MTDINLRIVHEFLAEIDQAKTEVVHPAQITSSSSQEGSPKNLAEHLYHMKQFGIVSLRAGGTQINLTSKGEQMLQALSTSDGWRAAEQALNVPEALIARDTLRTAFMAAMSAMPASQPA